MSHHFWNSLLQPRLSGPSSLTDLECHVSDLSSLEVPLFDSRDEQSLTNRVRTLFLCLPFLSFVGCPNLFCHGPQVCPTYYHDKVVGLFFKY